MVVDIRYHLASLVAVFLALGLGILVGTSLSDAEGWASQEEWLASLERRLGEIQERRITEASLLESAEQERDLYAEFASAIGGLLTAGELEGERAALVLFGGARSALEPVDALLEQAGAAVTRRLHVREEWSRSPELFGSILTFGDGRPSPAEPGLILAEAVARPVSQVFTTIEAPTVWFEALAGDAPTLVVFVLSGPAEAFAPLLETSAAALRDDGVRVAAVVPPEMVADWEGPLTEAGVPSVAHLGTPMGQLSLVALLGAQAADGIFGMDGERPVWPARLLEKRFSLWHEP